MWDVHHRTSLKKGDIHREEDANDSGGDDERGRGKRRALLNAAVDAFGEDFNRRHGREPIPVGVGAPDAT